MQNYYFPDGKLQETYIPKIEKGFKKYNLTFDISDAAKKKFTIKLIETEVQKIFELFKEYEEYKDSRRKQKSPEEFMNEAFKELKKCKNILSFEQLAETYGCNTTGFGFRQFNDFLRVRGVRNMTPGEFAGYVDMVASLRRGLVKHNYLADRNITLYRHSGSEAIIGMLINS